MNTRITLWLSAAIAGLWVCSLVLLYLLFPDLESRGQFGDQFGAVNALFSGLAFTVIFRALHAQHHEIKQQRDHFDRQVELTALTTYADLTLALWQHNERNKDAEKDSSRKQFWADSAKTRYEEMMRAREVFETILKEQGLLAKS